MEEIGALEQSEQPDLNSNDWNQLNQSDWSQIFSVKNDNFMIQFDENSGSIVHLLSFKFVCFIMF